ncbi:LysR family transcriptional regulator [Paraglaciecola sp.]|uniref:LysR family transcriptional regulator n=1 Tax=Paraglaciecola sp. TaxID=1920173 RepID=UPI003263707A
MLKLTRIFIKVVELGSFSKAAEVLNMAPSSVTRCIDSLESELGVTLLKRSTRQLVLTDKGHFFLSGSNKLIADSDYLIMSLSNKNLEPEGSLKISTFESFGRLNICPIIPEFLEKYPKINIEIELDNKMVDLVGGNIDLAIRIGIPEDSSLKSRKLLSNHTVICASPDYLLKHNHIQEPQDLSSHNCLLLNQQRQRTYWHFKKAHRNVKVLVNGNLKSKGGTPLLESALHGLGVVQLSNWIVADFVKNGELVVCLKGWEASLNERSSGNIYSIYKQSSYPNPNIRLFIDFLIEKTVRTNQLGDMR